MHIFQECNGNKRTKVTSLELKRWMSWIAQSGPSWGRELDSLV